MSFFEDIVVLLATAILISVIFVVPIIIRLFIRKLIDKTVGQEINWTGV